MSFGIDDAIATGLKIIDKFVADPEAKIKAEQELTKMANDLRVAELQADSVANQEVSKRWQADMASDSWLSKNIRPIVLIAILTGYFTFAMMSAFGFETRGAYVELLGQWGIIIFTAYFAGRTAEKAIDMKVNAK